VLVVQPLHPGDLVYRALERPVGLHVDRRGDAGGRGLGAVLRDRVVAAQRRVRAEDPRHRRPAQPGQVGEPPDVDVGIDDLVWDGRAGDRRSLAGALARQASGPQRRISYEQMIVLGIDPGLASTGFGVVERRGGRLVALDGGVLATDAGARPERRLGELHAALAALLREHGPNAMALESLYFGQNARSAFAVGQARGVAMLCAGQRGVSCHSYTPQQVKGAVCGSGRAPKDQVGRMVAFMLGLPAAPASEHAADALAVAICHANHAPLVGALEAVAG
jgi:crossover junction endodeoxyribonuclease RuvC